jgi:serine/threonine-protein kinase
MAMPMAGAVNASALLDLPAESRSQTIDGEMMGTAGYMAPEQVRGDMSTLTAAADVYALGAILFEILTLEPLHPGDRVAAVLFSTLNGRDARASVRRPDLEVPPELDAICVKATATEPGDRFPSARALHQAVERFLDGDRDLERRRQMALEHATAAAAAADQALSGGPGGAEARTQAMGEVGRALALDPTHPEAMRTLMRLLTEPPREVPEEVRLEIERSGAQALRFTNFASAVAYGSWFVCFLPLVLWMKIWSWPSFLLCWACVGAAGLLNALAARTPSKALTLSTLFANVVLALVASRMFGPFIFLPGVVMLTGLGYALHHDGRIRAGALIASCLSLVVPAALEWVHVLPASYSFHHGMMSVIPQMHGLAMVPATVFLCSGSVALVLTSLLFVGRIREALVRAERRVQLQTWQLSKLVPAQAQGAVAPASEALPSLRRSRGA